MSDFSKRIDEILREQEEVNRKEGRNAFKDFKKVSIPITGVKDMLNMLAAEEEEGNCDYGESFISPMEPSSIFKEEASKQESNPRGKRAVANLFEDVAQTPYDDAQDEEDSAEDLLKKYPGCNYYACKGFERKAAQKKEAELQESMVATARSSFIDATIDYLRTFGLIEYVPNMNYVTIYDALSDILKEVEGLINEDEDTKEEIKLTITALLQMLPALSTLSKLK